MINRKKTKRVLKPHVASTVGAILQTVVGRGTATRAQIPGVVIAGKTGTTESYGDAWFVGWTKEYTVAVWVGYPDEFKPMETEFQGEPVAGGTYPAGIWKTFMQALLKIDPLPKDDGGDGTGKPTPTPGAGVAPPATTAPAPTEAPPGTGGGTEAPAGAQPPVQEQPPAEEPPAEEPPATDPGRWRQTAPQGDAAAAAGPADAARAAAAGERRASRRETTGRSCRPDRAQTITTALRTRGCVRSVSLSRVSDTPPSRGVVESPAACPPLSAAVQAARLARRPGGQGRETSREPKAQKRHGRSAAFVIPIRGPVTYGSGEPRAHGPARTPARCRSPPAQSPAPA